MSNLRQYTGVYLYEMVEGQPVTFGVFLRVGLQSFVLSPPLPLDEAKWMQEQLTVALERIVKERRGDPTW